MSEDRNNGCENLITIQHFLSVKNTKLQQAKEIVIMPLKGILVLIIIMYTIQVSNFLSHFSDIAILENVATPQLISATV